MTQRLTLSQAMLSDLTVGELEVLEERTGRPLSLLFAPDAPRGALLHALAYIALRRDDPEVTWEGTADVHVTLEDDDAEEVVGHTRPTPVGRRRRAG